MKTIYKVMLLAATFFFSVAIETSASERYTDDADGAAVDSDCTCNGVPLKGKVKVVTDFADFKVQVVESFADLKVKVVEAFPDDCGEWQFVEDFPDFTIKYVENFGDFKIRFVTAFPGVE